MSEKGKPLRSIGRSGDKRLVYDEGMSGHNMPGCNKAGDEGVGCITVFHVEQ